MGVVVVVTYLLTEFVGRINCMGKLRLGCRELCVNVHIYSVAYIKNHFVF